MFTTWVVLSGILTLFALVAAIISIVIAIDERPDTRFEWWLIFLGIISPFFMWAWPVIIPGGLIAAALYALRRAMRSE